MNSSCCCSLPANTFSSGSKTFTLGNGFGDTWGTNFPTSWWSATNCSSIVVAWIHIYVGGNQVVANAYGTFLSTTRRKYILIFHRDLLQDCVPADCFCQLHESLQYYHHYEYPFSRYHSHLRLRLHLCQMAEYGGVLQDWKYYNNCLSVQQDCDSVCSASSIELWNLPSVYYFGWQYHVPNTFT